MFPRFEGTKEMISVIKKDFSKILDLIKNAPLREGQCNKFGGYDLLCLAIECGQNEIAERLMNEGGVEVNSNSENPTNTPLHIAVLQCDIEIVSMLIDKGARVNAKNADGSTALYLAIEKKHINIIKTFLEHGADVNLRGPNNMMLLHLAAKIGIEDICQLLIESGADVHAKGEREVTALHIATEEGHESIAKILLEHGADVNVKNAFGEAPLRLAATKGREHMCKLLLEAGAEVDAIDEYGITALHDAVKYDKEDIVKILLEHGADVKLETYEEQTPLHLVVDGDTDICRLLLDAGADVHARNEDGLTPLELAVMREREAIVHTFLEYNVHVNLNAEDSATLLILAVAVGGTGYTLRLLLKSGVDVHARDIDEVTALHVAAQRDNIVAMEYLLNWGADIDSIDNNGNTPLHLAADSGQYNAVRFLTENDANVHIVNKKDKTAFQLVNNFKYIIMDSPPFQIYGLEKTARNKLTIIREHILKIQIATSDMNEENLEYFRSAKDKNWQCQLVKRCKKEIERMKNTRINNSYVTFYDILTKRIEDRVLYARNENIVRFMGANNFQNEFPDYADIIIARFERGLVRQRLLKEGHKFFRARCHAFYNLPDVCVEEILSYLGNMDLRSLKTAYNTVDFHNKMRSMQSSLSM